MSEDLAQVVSGLVDQVNRLTVRLNVALDLLAEVRLTGSPDNAEYIAERLAQAEAALALPTDPAASGAPAQYTWADTDEPTSVIKKAAARSLTETAPYESVLDDDGGVRTGDYKTERERKLEQVLGTLEDLAKPR